MKNNFTTKAFVALLAIGSFVSVHAQTIIKVGAGQGEKQKTIQMAYDSIVPATLEGAYVLEIQSDYDPTTEVYPITFTEKTGASSTNNITIKPASGVKKIISAPDSTVIFTNLSFESGVSTLSVPSVEGVKAGMSVYGVGLSFLSTPYRFHTVASVDAGANTISLADATASASTADKKTFVGKSETRTIVFDGAKYVTIDGVSRTGDSGLEICNPNSIYAQTIQFKNNATNNTIKNCIIRGANISGQINNGFAGTIYFSGGQYNTITDNDVCDMNDPNIPYPICPFQMTAAGGSNNNNTVTNNNIYNISNYYSANGPFTFMQFGSEGSSSNNVVMNNRYYWTAPVLISGNFIPINIGSLGSGNRFENNVIGYGAADGTGTSIVTSNNGSWGTGNGFRYFSCKNNTVAEIQFTGTGFRGLWAHTSSTSYAADDIMSGNTVKDIVFTSVGNDKYMEGIYVNGALATGVNVKNNTVNNIMIISEAQNKCTAYGIRVNGTNSNEFNYTGNKISNIVSGDVNSTAGNIAYGMYVTQNSKTIIGNLIANVNAQSTASNSIVRGLQTNGSQLGGQLFANNIVRLGTNVSSDASVTAMFQEAALSAGDPVKIYNNTFYVGGAAPSAATKSTYGYYRNPGNAHAVYFQNNIVVNKRTVAAQEAHYPMYINGKYEFSACNNNLYQYTTSMGFIKELDAAAPDLAGWQDGTEMDANSVAGDPLLTAPEATEIDMNIGENSPARGAGANLTSTVADDFYGRTRTTNDIGAVAYFPTSGLNSTKFTNTLNVKIVNDCIIIEGQEGKVAEVYGLTGQTIKRVVLNSDNETIKLSNGFYIVKVAALKAKVLIK